MNKHMKTTSKNKSIFKKGQTYYAVVAGNVYEVKFIKEIVRYSAWCSGNVVDKIEYVFEYTYDELLQQVKLSKENVFNDYATANMAITVDSLVDKINRQQAKVNYADSSDHFVSSAHEKPKSFLEKLFNL